MPRCLLDRHSEGSSLEKQFSGQETSKVEVAERCSKGMIQKRAEEEPGATHLLSMTLFDPEEREGSNKTTLLLQQGRSSQKTHIEHGRSDYEFGLLGTDLHIFTFSLIIN